MEKEMNTKFVVGDEVTIVSNGNHGTVKSIASYLGEGRNIYLVRVDNVDKMCVESNLEIYRKKNTVFNLDLNEAGINFMIEDRINEIIEMLGLKRTKEDKDQLLNAAKLQAYLTISDDYENEKNSIGNNILKYNLYNGLVNGVDEPIINSCIFTQVLRKIGMDVKNVVLKLQDNAFYVANLVLIGKDYYFFDLTLEREIFRDNGENIENFILCCAALGKNSYTQFFKPLCVIDFNDILGPSMLPKNISTEDIDIDLLNKLLNMGE